MYKLALFDYVDDHHDVDADMTPKIFFKNGPTVLKSGSALFYDSPSGHSWYTRRLTDPQN